MRLLIEFTFGSFIKLLPLLLGTIFERLIVVVSEDPAFPLLGDRGLEGS
jgi:hypothetical protein